MSFVVKHITPDSVEWLSEANSDKSTWVWSKHLVKRIIFDSVDKAQAAIKGNPRTCIIESVEDKDHHSSPAKLYKLTQREYKGYDTFDSCIVVAHSEDEARLIHPRPGSKLGFGWRNYDRSWVSKEQTHLIAVEELGIAYDHLQPGTVIMSSFNAG